MTFKESYQLHKNKCIKNASRIEAAINQLTNLKNAENFVMTGNESSKVLITNAFGEFTLPVERTSYNGYVEAFLA